MTEQNDFNAELLKYLDASEEDDYQFAFAHGTPEFRAVVIGALTNLAETRRQLAQEIERRRDAELVVKEWACPNCNTAWLRRSLKGAMAMCPKCSTICGPKAIVDRHRAEAKLAQALEALRYVDKRAAAGSMEEEYKLHRRLENCRRAVRKAIKEIEGEEK